MIINRNKMYIRRRIRRKMSRFSWVSMKKTFELYRVHLYVVENRKQNNIHFSTQ